MIHLLAEGKVMGVPVEGDHGKKVPMGARLLVTLAGEPWNKPNNRIHSITKVQRDANRIVSGFPLGSERVFVIHGFDIEHGVQSVMLERFAPKIKFHPHKADKFPSTRFKLIVRDSFSGEKIKEAETDIQINHFTNKLELGLNIKDDLMWLRPHILDLSKINMEDKLKFTGLISSISYKGLNNPNKANTVTPRIWKK